MLSDADCLLLLSYSHNNYSIRKVVKKQCGLVGLYEHFSKLLGFDLKEKQLEQIHRDLTKKKVQYLPFSDERYPKRLKEINDPPLGLFCRGNIDTLSRLKNVGIVGTRKATRYGKRIALNIASLLSEKDVVVVSGMASGIDTEAHKGGIKGGNTIAVLGTGVDEVYPASNRTLYEEIIKNNGLIASELPLKAQGMPWNFPQRNRIISALSDASIVVEGDLRSGALITARFAIKQNKKIYAVPGNLDSQVSNGPNILIKSKVAEMFTSVNELLEDLYGEKQLELSLKSDKELDLSSRQQMIYKKIGSDACDIDSLSEEIDLPLSVLLGEISTLELKGVVEVSDGIVYRL